MVDTCFTMFYLFMWMFFCSCVSWYIADGAVLFLRTVPSLDGPCQIQMVFEYRGDLPCHERPYENGFQKTMAYFTQYILE